MTEIVTRDAARNATLQDLVALLKDQQARTLDIVAPASQMRFRDGVLHLKGTEALITDDGVTRADGAYRPTAVFDEGVAAKLNVPLSWVRRMRTERPDLYDSTVNGLLHGRQRVTPEGPQVLYPGDDRSFMLRLFRGGGLGDEGVARALLSSKYFRNDNLDFLTASMAGIAAAGVDVNVASCDLTDRRMYVRITCPQVTALAPTLLKNYRSPFSGQTGADNPVVWAGFIISNSEVGGGAATITPSLQVQVCTNGLTITKDAMRAVHLGGRMEDGIQWSRDTQQKQLALITAKARDAVRTFLNVDYMQGVLAEIERKAGAELTKPEDDIKAIGKALAFDQATIDGVLSHFIKGGDITAGGVLHAVTSYAQTVQDADAAYDIEAAGIKALELAAARA